LKVDRNKFAADLVTLVHAGQRSAPPFTLFLRPFFSEAARWSDDQFDIANFRHGNGLEWDVSLADAFDHLAPSVKIGGKSSRLNNAPGAGIVRVSDDNWQSTFLSLLSSCKYAVITPVMQPATAWEIEQAITREDLKKCIFFLPPLTLVDFADVPVLGRLFGSLGPGDYKADPSIRSFQDAWTHSRTILAARGLLLPDLGRFGFFARRTDVGEIRVVHLKTQDRVLSDEALDAVKLLLVD